MDAVTDSPVARRDHGGDCHCHPPWQSPLSPLRGVGWAGALGAAVLGVGAEGEAEGGLVAGVVLEEEEDPAHPGGVPEGDDQEVRPLVGLGGVMEFGGGQANVFSERILLGTWFLFLRGWITWGRWELEAWCSLGSSSQQSTVSQSIDRILQSRVPTNCLCPLSTY